MGNLAAERATPATVNPTVSRASQGPHLGGMLAAADDDEEEDD